MWFGRRNGRSNEQKKGVAMKRMDWKRAGLIGGVIGSLLAVTSMATTRANVPETWNSGLQGWAASSENSAVSATDAGGQVRLMYSGVSLPQSQTGQFTADQAVEAGMFSGNLTAVGATGVWSTTSAFCCAGRAGVSGAMACQCRRSGSRSSYLPPWLRWKGGAPRIPRTWGTPGNLRRICGAWLNSALK